MRALFVNVPLLDYSKCASKEYSTIIPVGLGYIVTVLRDEGFDADLLDAEHERRPIDDIVRIAREYDIVGINIPTPSLDIPGRIIEELRDKHITIGGVHVTCEPEMCFNELEPDSMIVGESEHAIVNLFKRLEGNADEPVKGLYLKGKSYDSFQRADPIEDLDTLPFLDRSIFVNEPYSTGTDKEVTISTTRGCPFSCHFCSVPKIFGKRLRCRSPRNIMEEIRILYGQGISSFRFMDDNFLVRTERIRTFCSMLRENGQDLRWRSLARIDKLDEDIIPEMAKSGCYRLAFGIETIHPRIQRGLGKEENPDRMREIITHCKRWGIKTKGFFTLGYPDETEEEIEMTLKASRELGLDDVNYNILRAFPCTDLTEMMLKKGYSKEHTYTFHQFDDMHTRDGLDKESIRRLDAIEREGINLNMFLKYHFSNIRPLNGMGLERLDGIIRKGYIDFYYSRINDE